MDRRCGRGFAKLPEARQEAASWLAFAYGVRLAVYRMTPAMRQFRTDLANVPTLDPALIAGRAAVRRLGRAWAAVPPPESLCRQLRAWRRAGCPRSTTRAAESQLHELFDAFSPAIARRFEAAGLRMRELGVSREDAERFGGEGGW